MGSAVQWEVGVSDVVWVWIGGALGSMPRAEFEDSIYADSVDAFDSKEDAMDWRAIEEACDETLQQ